MLQLQGASHPIHAKYLVAADGASSNIRKQLGIRMIGEPALQHLVNIHFFSKELWHHLRDRPAMLYFVFSSQAIVVLVAHNLQEGEMVAQVNAYAMHMHTAHPVHTLTPFGSSVLSDMLSFET